MVSWENQWSELRLSKVIPRKEKEVADDRQEFGEGKGRWLLSIRAEK